MKVDHIQTPVGRKWNRTWRFGNKPLLFGRGFCFANNSIYLP